MAIQLRIGGGVFLSQWSPQLVLDSHNRNGRRLVIGGESWERSRFTGLVHCNSRSSNNGSSDAKKGVPNSNYVVPLNKSFSASNSSYITRPLVEILRDLNKRIPDNIVKPPSDSSSTFLPWYHANRMLSFYAPGWCGEVRDVIFSENGTITVVYRLTIRGSDGEILNCDVTVIFPWALSTELSTEHPPLEGFAKSPSIFLLICLPALKMKQ